MNKLQITQPPPLGIECIKHPLAVGEHWLVVWDPNVRFGGLYQIEPAMWATFGPFDSVTEFKRYIASVLPETGAKLH